MAASFCVSGILQVKETMALSPACGGMVQSKIFWIVPVTSFGAAMDTTCFENFYDNINSIVCDN